jgi:hypothetical protein
MRETATTPTATTSSRTPRASKAYKYLVYSRTPNWRVTSTEAVAAGVFTGSLPD